LTDVRLSVVKEGMAFTATLYGDPLPEGHKFPALDISLNNTRERRFILLCLNPLLCVGRADRVIVDNHPTSERNLPDGKDLGSLANGVYLK
jgi:hypothetical protein